MHQLSPEVHIDAIVIPYGMIFLKYQNLSLYIIFYLLYQIDKRQPDSFKTEMKDNVANTRQNNGIKFIYEWELFFTKNDCYRGKII